MILTVVANELLPTVFKEFDADIFRRECWKKMVLRNDFEKWFLTVILMNCCQHFSKSFLKEFSQRDFSKRFLKEIFLETSFFNHFSIILNINSSVIFTCFLKGFSENITLISFGNCLKKCFKMIFSLFQRHFS